MLESQKCSLRRSLKICSGCFDDDDEDDEGGGGCWETSLGSGCSSQENLLFDLCIEKSVKLHELPNAPAQHFCPIGWEPRPKYSRFSAAGKNLFPLEVQVLPEETVVACGRKPASWSGLFRFWGPNGGGELWTVFWYSGLLGPWTEDSEDEGKALSPTWPRSSYLGFRTPDAALLGPFMVSFI